MNTVLVIPEWVQEARKMPVYFSQVREDAFIDLQVSRLIGKNIKVMMVASGGCTAAALAASGFVSSLHMVDQSASQLALTKLKLKLLVEANTQERLSVLGYTRERFELSLSTLMAGMNLKEEIFGDLQTVNALGLDFCGRYEQVFAQLRKELSSDREVLNKLLALKNPVKQNIYLNEDTALRQKLRLAFEKVMTLPNLRNLFGEAATKNRRTAFAEHFFERTQNVICTQPAGINPYLHSILTGTGRRFSPWLAMPSPAKMPSCSFIEGDMLSALSVLHCKYDLIHLSNICDWLDEDEAKQLLSICHSRLNYGGMVLIRQLNSTLDIPGLSTQFDWQTEFAEDLLNTDRSFFYQSIHVGLK
jgi:S-adenosylmethionine-diacylglycerol 3-amino-3-carboxypropyl transferase